jgi:cytochrome o ubiquinol oxidase subunit IV
MTTPRYDRAPGDQSVLTDKEEATSSGALIYSIGLLLAVILTAASFWVANTSLLWAPGVPLGLAVLAIAQMGIHLVFFLHITTGPDNTNNVLALAFGVLIVTLVVAGSLAIMANLNGAMMPPADIMDMQTIEQRGIPRRTEARTFEQASIACRPKTWNVASFAVPRLPGSVG